MSVARPGVLRGITLDAQPRSLQRAAQRGAAPPAPMSGGSGGDGESRAAASLAALAADAERAGYDAGHTRGLEEGRRLGLAEGTAEAKKRIEAAVREATQSAADEALRRQHRTDAAADAERATLVRIQQELGLAAEARLGALEADAIELAFAAVCRIVGADGDRRDRVRELVTTAMRARGRARLLRVRVPPEDLACLQAAGLAQADSSADAPVAWLADASLASPGCIFESEQGSLDALLETQLARLRDAWCAAAGWPAGEPQPATPLS